MEKEILLEVRAMNWRENLAFDDMRQKAVAEESVSAEQLGRKCIEWVMDNIYPGMIEKLTAAETLAVYSNTMDLTNAVRYDEIKNLKPLSNGSKTGATIAPTAAE